MKNNFEKKMLVILLAVVFIATSLVSAIGLKSKNLNVKNEISKLNINDGLVGYWSFDYEDAEDESDNNNFGIINGATVIDGISG